MKNWTILNEGNKQFSAFNIKTCEDVLVSYKFFEDEVILSDEAKRLPKSVQNTIRKEAKKGRWS